MKILYPSIGEPFEDGSVQFS